MLEFFGTFTVHAFFFSGTTKAVIPILEKMGIEAISIGVNGATTPASVPPVFRWQSGNSSVLALYHPGRSI